MWTVTAEIVFRCEMKIEAPTDIEASDRAERIMLDTVAEELEFSVPKDAVWKPKEGVLKLQFCDGEVIEAVECKASEGGRK